jgi:excisionase family DNA binding protein
MTPTEVDGLGPCWSLTEAAHTLGVSRQAVYQAIQRGRLQATVRQVAGYRVLWLPVASVSTYRESRRRVG